MSFFSLRTWQLGVKSLLLHPLRSLLTVLGIFIGVASVIWLLAIGEGISRKAREQIEGLGADNIIVRSNKPPSEVAEKSGRLLAYGISREDYKRLVNTIPTIRSALPIREIRRRFGFGPHLVDGRLVGCTPEYMEVTRLEVDRGRFLTDVEVNEKQNHCVLAAEVAERLFPLDDPLGKSIHVEEAYYVVVGVMKPKTATAAIGGSFAAQEFSNDVYVPIATLQARIGDLVVTRRSGSFEAEQVELSQITLRIDKVDNVRETARLVEETLRRVSTHRTNRDYAIVVPYELLEQARTTRLMFMVFMGVIAAISLVVGGIGIMNIMLATVTERTREIGIRRALGAKRRDIVRQFLIETIVLSAVGGVTGVLAGLACPAVIGWIWYLLDKYLPKVMAQLPEVIKSMEPVVVPESIPLAFGIAVTIGVVFGLYPAMRAASMDPIEALRHE
jgi:putative ABC transport system permease protein